MEDRLLVLRCRQGSAGAMARIYRKYRKDLLILAIALLNDKAAAEDVVHDVFVAFAEGLARFRLTGSLKSYLMTCTANRARNYNKARREPDPSCVVPPDSRVFDAEPVERLICNEQLQRLAAALNQLPYEQREVLMLQSHGGLTLRAIAKRSGLPANTIMSRYRYGVNKLRHLLNGECDHET